jgi:hypothetical protein
VEQQNEALKTELEYFEERRRAWLATLEGQFALIRGPELIGTYSTFSEAYTAGVERFGNVPMLIRQIVAEDPEHQAPALQHGLIQARA